ncbi:hypothetical protein Scep_028056 [Stephania cephalantha]|uniref:Uncharacterized protein n=1 Tax=Stephania cephalantha TaxID=152367 RepID=A0AAP0EHK4_9MAGN
MGIRWLVTRRYAYIAVRTRNRASKRPKIERVSQLLHPLVSRQKVDITILIYTLQHHFSHLTHTLHPHHRTHPTHTREAESEEEEDERRRRSRDAPGRSGDATIEVDTVINWRPRTQWTWTRGLITG